jgi:hypothetical protein
MQQMYHILRYLRPFVAKKRSGIAHAMRQSANGATALCAWFKSIDERIFEISNLSMIDRIAGNVPSGRNAKLRLTFTSATF